MVDNPKAPSPIDVHVGQRIKQRRTLVGISQSDLGGAVGVTFQQVQKYEKGVNRIGVTRLAQIAQVLSTSLNYFFEGMPGILSPGTQQRNPEDIDLLIELLSSEDGQAMARSFIRIEDPAARRTIVDLVKLASNGGRKVE